MESEVELDNLSLFDKILYIQDDFGIVMDRFYVSVIKSFIETSFHTVEAFMKIIVIKLKLEVLLMSNHLCKFI